MDLGLGEAFQDPFADPVEEGVPRGQEGHLLPLFKPRLRQVQKGLQGALDGHLLPGVVGEVGEVAPAADQDLRLLQAP